jgi:nitrite reductase/ring-hydroxylating ferredoxin subunit
MLSSDYPTMTDRTAVTTVETLSEDESFLFTVTDTFDVEAEVVLVPCVDGAGVGSERDGERASERADGRELRCWLNRCTHEAQRLDTGRGVPMRDGQIICPRHGSLFDACSGDCDNGKAAGTTLPAVEVTVEDGTVFLTDDDYTFAHEGGIDDSEGPSSTSHVGF